jgi:DNA-binding HxlR family transcriptional regulator
LVPEHSNVTVLPFARIAPASAELPTEADMSGQEGGQEEGHGDCRKVGQILARVGDKWSVLVVMLLGHGPRRFNEMKRMVGGISQRMLTLTLKGLERDGMVTRTAYPTIPPRVDYALTPLGRSLLEPVMALGNWAQANMACIDAARAAFDRRAGG